MVSHPFAKNANGWGTQSPDFPVNRPELLWFPAHFAKDANGSGTQSPDFPVNRPELLWFPAHFAKDAKRTGHGAFVLVLAAA
jgi:hypothetical protein